MSDLTRRGFVKNSAAATAGITVIGALLAEQADAHAGRAGIPGGRGLCPGSPQGRHLGPDGRPRGARPRSQARRRDRARRGLSADRRRARAATSTARGTRLTDTNRR